MKRSIVIHPDFTALRPFVEAVAENRAGEGRPVYRTRRNTITAHMVQGEEINVKRYKIPIFVNRIVYTFFRKSKARRAYENGLMLMSHHIGTAAPVAYVENFRHGLLHTSYLLTRQCPYTHTMYEFGTGDEKGREDILRALGRFTAALHRAGILHADYSPGNILFEQVDGTWQFCLVDINRMRRKKFNLESGCRNFERLWGTARMFTLMAEAYAEAMGYDKAACVERTLYYRNRFWTRYNRRHPARQQPLL